LSHIAKTAKAVQRLRDTGIIDLGNLGVTPETVKNADVYGPQATLTIQGGRSIRRCLRSPTSAGP
jgi:fatty-acyl-CoA synthase